MDGPLPKGKYNMWVINQNHPKGPNQIAFNIYAEKKMPSIDKLKWSDQNQTNIKPNNDYITVY